MAPKQAFGITNSCFIQQYFRGSVMQNKPCNPEQDSPSAIVCVDLNIRCTFCVCVCVSTSVCTRVHAAVWSKVWCIFFVV